MNVSVCVVFRNSEKTLPDLIRSFRYLPSQKHQFEFLFIDNNSTDQSAKIILDSKLENLHLIHRAVNHLAEARNQALELSQFEYVYFIDSDCSLTEDTWPELLKNADFDGYQAWGGSQNFPEDISFLKILDQMRLSYLGHFGSAQMKLGKESVSVDHLSTSHALYKKEVLTTVGGFHSDLKLSAEDLELSLRLKKSGYKLQFIPTSKVVHQLCNDWRGWFKKAWRNGIWQTRLVGVNPDIIKTRRFWPPLVIFLSFLILPIQTLLFFFLIYVLILIAISFTNSHLNKKQSLALFLLFISTHFIYFISGLWGLVLAIEDFANSYTKPKVTKL